jgi:hypothetical protein
VAIAPLPTSPHAKSLDTGGMICRVFAAPRHTHPFVPLSRLDVARSCHAHTSHTAFQLRELPTPPTARTYGTDATGPQYSLDCMRTLQSSYSKKRNVVGSVSREGATAVSLRQLTHKHWLQCGPRTLAPSCCKLSRWRCVNGESHMNVFIAGATSSGLLKSHARTTQLSRLSHSPLASCTCAPPAPPSESLLVAHVRSSPLPHVPPQHATSVTARDGAILLCKQQTDFFRTTTLAPTSSKPLQGVQGADVGRTPSKESSNGWAEKTRVLRSERAACTRLRSNPARGTAAVSCDQRCETQLSDAMVERVGWVTLASVLADSGAMSITSAQRRSSMCITSSPTCILFAPHMPLHRSQSPGARHSMVRTLHARTGVGASCADAACFARIRMARARAGMELQRQGWAVLSFPPRQGKPCARFQPRLRMA